MAKKRYRLLYHFLKEYRDNAKKRGIEWRLDDEEFIAVSGLHCHYCGSPPKRITRSRWSSGKRYGASEAIEVLNGIDRIDPTKGYYLANIVACCKMCNRGKSDMT